MKTKETECNFLLPKLKVKEGTVCIIIGTIPTVQCNSAFEFP